MLFPCVGLLLVALISSACASVPEAARTKVASKALPVATAAEPSPEDLPGLDASAISPVVMARYSAVGGCHTIQYSGRPNAAGVMTVDWVIQPDGSVESAEVIESSFTDEQFHDCVLTVAQRMRFPEALGTTPVSWKFKFAAKSGVRENNPATFRQ